MTISAHAYYIGARTASTTRANTSTSTRSAPARNNVAAAAFAVFYRRHPDPAVLAAPGPAWYRFLLNKWYFDEVYDATIVEPTVALAHVADVARGLLPRRAHRRDAEPSPRCEARLIGGRARCRRRAPLASSRASPFDVRAR